MKKQKNKNRLHTKVIAVLLTIAMFMSMSITVFAEQPPDEAGGYSEGLVDSLGFDPAHAISIQDRIDGNVDTGEVLDLREFGDLSLVLHTLTGNMGMQGFEGPYALPENPTQLVEISVQFVTPPTEVLRLLSSANHPFMAHGARARMPYEATALAAHAAFEDQLAGVIVPMSDDYAAPRIIETEHNIFNGALMTVPAGLVPQIAELEEVFVVTPNYQLEILDDEEEEWNRQQFLELVEVVAEMAEYYDDEADIVVEITEDYDYETDVVPATVDAFPFFNAPTANVQDWVPGSNTFSRGFMRESRERFGMNLQDGGFPGVATGDGVRAILLDSGLDYNHPRYHQYHYPNMRMSTGALGNRIPGSGGAAGVVPGPGNPASTPGSTGQLGLLTVPGAANILNTPQEAVWANGWGDGGNHGTHVIGSVMGMAPDVYIYAYRGTGTGVWGIVGAFNRMWLDGHRMNAQNEWYKHYTRNVVNISLGGGATNAFSASSYATNVMVLTGYYLIVGSAGNSGPHFYNVTPPGDATLMLTVGAGRAGGWVSPYIFETASVSDVDGNPVTARIDLKTWNWAWMPHDTNGWMEAFPANMGDILGATHGSPTPAHLPHGVFNRAIVPFATMEQNNIPRWQRGNGLLRFNAEGQPDPTGNYFEYIWVGNIADSDAGRNAAVARLRYLGIEIDGRVIVQGRNAVGTPGQMNPRDFWAQQGAGALIVVDSMSPGTTFSYSGGAGVAHLIQGSIPLMSMPSAIGQEIFPFPAGLDPSPVWQFTWGGETSIPVTSNAATAIENIDGTTAGGVRGLINLGALTDHSIRDEQGNFVSQENKAPNYLARFSSLGPQRHTYNLGPNIVGPGTQVHSTVPAWTSDRWARANRDADGNFILNAAGNPVRNAAWYANPASRDWSTGYAMFMGTSMSSPTVAGIAALVWSAFPDSTPQEVTARIMNTAIEMGEGHRNYNIFQRGAGFVNPELAVTQQAVATVLVDMPWNFHANWDPTAPPGTIPNPPGGQGNFPPIGANPPGGNQQTLLVRQTQSALAFGPVSGETSQTLTVTIQNAGATPWTHTHTFSPATAAEGAVAPFVHYNSDVVLRQVGATRVNGTTQELDFEMYFPEGVPYGWYSGDVVFTHPSGSASGQITMPFIGVPYRLATEENPVGISLGNAGMFRPIITNWLRGDAEDTDPRHATSGNIAALTHSNRSSVSFSLDILGVHPGFLNTGNTRWFSLYAREVVNPGEDTEALGNTAYVFGSASGNANSLLTWGQIVTSRVNNPLFDANDSNNNEPQFLYLDSGVYELFLHVYMAPPRVEYVDGVPSFILPRDAVSFPMNRFVVADLDMRPELDFAVVGATLTGRLSSPAHDLAIAQGVQTPRVQNAAGTWTTGTPVNFTYEHAGIFINGTLHRPRADGTFSIAIPSGLQMPLRVSAVDALLSDFNTGATGATSNWGALTSVHSIAPPAEFNGTNPNRLTELLAVTDVVLTTRGNLGIFAQHGQFVIPEGRTLTVDTALNIHRDATLVVEGTLVISGSGRLNNQGVGSNIVIADTGRLVVNGWVENVSGSRITNAGEIEIASTGRLNVRANVSFCLEECGTVDNTAEGIFNVHRDAIELAGCTD
ncbi:MAG: S8 family serine peptidase [Oscillospiraceae bacterium]|nr:S8 family serine peptidase [Oscillospiraceae bacterium]